MTIKHTDDSLAATYFAQRHSGWNTYALDKRTERAIERARELGAVETNEFRQFRAIDRNAVAAQPFPNGRW